MDIIEPVTLGDVACTRASPKWVFDRNGTLAQVPANTLAVTYNPNDLTKAPYADVDLLPATNFVSFSSLRESSSVYAIFGTSVADGGVVAGAMGPDGITGVRRFNVTNPDALSTVRFGDTGSGTPGTAYFGSVMVRTPDGVARTVTIDCCDGDTQVVEVSGAWKRLSAKNAPANLQSYRFFDIQFGSNGAYDVFGIQISDRDVSYIPNATAAPATRAADVIAPGAGVVYSNAPIDVQTYDAGTTYAKDALVYDPVAHNVFQSLIASNVGKDLTDTTAWTPRGAINRWAMLDQYNNTQTSVADEILLVVSPQTISQGFYIGNVDATEVRLSVVDLYGGLVYQEVQSLAVSTSGSSFFNWCFKRRRRRNWAVSLDMPPYANALITISIRKIGSTAKCGMCVVGPTMDLGRTLMTLGAEIKDFSDTSFNFDGTSATTYRNWAKRITADVVVDADQVDAVYDVMAEFRQRLLVWIGSRNFGLAIACGRYSSLKPVVKGKTRWDMSLQIEGAV